MYLIIYLIISLCRKLLRKTVYIKNCRVAREQNLHPEPGGIKAEEVDIPIQLHLALTAPILH